MDDRDLTVEGYYRNDDVLTETIVMFIIVFALLPSGSPFGDPGPHGDLFQFLGPQKVPIFFQGPHFLYFRLKNALKVRASTIILVICILKGEFSETHLFNENGANLCTK